MKKTILGQKHPSLFSVSEKHKIIEEYLSSESTKCEIWEKYTGRKEEKGKLLNWMRQLGYSDKKNSFVLNLKRKQAMQECSKPETDFEKLQLERRIKELEARLEQSEMQRIAYQMMIEFAEKEFNISIQKKSVTKPSK